MPKEGKWLKKENQIKYKNQGKHLFTTIPSPHPNAYLSMFLKEILRFHLLNTKEHNNVISIKYPFNTVSANSDHISPLFFLPLEVSILNTFSQRQLYLLYITLHQSR